MELTRQEKRLQDALAAGPQNGETQEQWAARVAKIAASVDEDAKANFGDSLDAGIDVSIPVSIAAPVVTKDRVKKDKADHSAEIVSAAKRNKAIIIGAAALIAGGATLAVSGNPTALLSAVLSAAKSIRDFLAGTTSTDAVAETTV